MNILIYDSGVGGRSVFKLIDAYLTEKNLHDKVVLEYFKDTEHYPYGTKTESELKEIVFNNLKDFKEKNSDQIVVACNTASSVIEKESGVMSGVTTIVQPTVEAIKILQPTSIYVIASNFTANTHVYSRSLQLAKVDAEVTEHGEQTLINAIEADDTELIQKEVSRIVSQVPEGALFLWGCTHFSLVKNVFNEEMKKQNKHNEVVDPALELAKVIILRLQNLQN